ncbi:MAG: hypothetical protein JRF27_02020 [Deltaproteobacteria bacterium]|nr:hypothetical protein [Deltaproteobacteria bacterium]MBW2192543.1 hypothetical protein [Deltaproteobacteria bacterium]
MRNGYFIIIASFCLCFPAWICAGTGPPGSPVGSTIRLFQAGSPIQAIGRYLAQNDNRETLVDSADVSNEKPKDTTLPDTPKKEENAPKKTEPLKPFVPSEKIPADQGVDFPYDI